MSGKSPGYRHPRKNFKSPSRETGSGFLIWNCGPHEGCLLTDKYEVGQARTFLLPQLRCPRICGICGDVAMKRLFALILIAGSFTSLEARAQERAGDAALGAVSGAVVLGPVGAVAGAIIGYTAGPSISRSWGVGRSSSRPRGRRVTQTSLGPEGATPASASSLPADTASKPVASVRAPPVQGFE
jgi:hypothetical protein